jgi:hypothetical protein
MNRYFYGFTNLDVALDNIRINRIPQPAALGMQVMGAWLLRRCSTARMATPRTLR